MNARYETNKLEEEKGETYMSSTYVPRVVLEGITAECVMVVSPVSDYKLKKLVRVETKDFRKREKESLPEFTDATLFS